MTITLYNFIQSELIKKGLNEIVDANGNLIFFNEDAQFMTKIFSYDADISDIVNKLFNGVGLPDTLHDQHFKKAFMFRFINRRINRQTIEAFKMELLSTFLVNQTYINRVYADLELFLLQTKQGENSTKNIHQENTKNNTTNTNEQTNSQTNNQTTDGTSTTDNRDAEATLPQNNVQLDVNSTVMTSANSNRIARNKQLNNQETVDVAEGETVGTSETLSSGEVLGTANGDSTSEDKAYSLDELFKTNGLEEQIYNVFDRKCFMQIW